MEQNYESIIHLDIGQQPKTTSLSTKLDYSQKSKTAIDETISTMTKLSTNHTSLSHHNDKNSSPSNQKSIHIAFWLLGLLNNSAYVIMIAGAKSISEGGTALVFIVNTFPSMLVKLSAPYWFHLVGYRARINAAAILFAMSFTTVAIYGSDTIQTNFNLSSIRVEDMKLLGVSFSSIGGGLGEASLLALGGRYDAGKKGVNLTSFASGTGLAGVFGFLWVGLFHQWLGYSFSSTLLLANILAFLYALVYRTLLCEDDINENVLVLHDPLPPYEFDYDDENDEEVELNLVEKDDDDDQQFSNAKSKSSSKKKGYEGIDGDEEDDYDDGLFSTKDSSLPSSKTTRLENMDVSTISTWDRIRLVCSLWPYMIPLFFVYFAEYALQSGAWTAIGFPVDDEIARDKFYSYSNWMYQAGVFVSRSSGTIFQASLITLWILPVLQCINLIFFVWTGITHFWYDWTLLLPCFGAGLLGGAVYVNAFTRINADLPAHQKEFALSSASVADSFGIVVADIMGLFIQSCLYMINNIPDAAVSCPV